MSRERSCEERASVCEFVSSFLSLVLGGEEGVGGDVERERERETMKQVCACEEHKFEVIIMSIRDCNVIFSHVNLAKNRTYTNSIVSFFSPCTTHNAKYHIISRSSSSSSCSHPPSHLFLLCPHGRRRRRRSPTSSSGADACGRERRGGTHQVGRGDPESASGAPPVVSLELSSRHTCRLPNCVCVRGADREHQ